MNCECADWALVYPKEILTRSIRLTYTTYKEMLLSSTTNTILSDAHPGI